MGKKNVLQHESGAHTPKDTVAIFDSKAKSKRKGISKDRLTGLRKLEPIETVDELIDLAVKILEAPDNSDEYELFLDGLDRLNTKRDDDFARKTSSLRKKIVKDSSMTGIVPIHSWTTSYPDEKPLIINDCGYALCALMVIWTAESREKLPDGNIRVIFEKESTVIAFQALPTLDVLFMNRLRSLAWRMCDGKIGQSLSTPTHGGGWIDPVSLVKRILGSPDSLETRDIYDRILALYRLAPDHRDKALKLLPQEKSDDIFMLSLRSILGDPAVVFSENDIRDDKTENIDESSMKIKKEAKIILKNPREERSEKIHSYILRFKRLTPEKRLKTLEILKANPNPLVTVELLRELLKQMMIPAPELGVECSPNCENEEELIRRAMITATVRVRNPQSDPVKESLDVYPESSLLEHLNDPVRDTSHDCFPLYYMHQPYFQMMHFENKGIVAEIRWRATIFPSHREPIYYHAILPLVKHVDAGGNYQGPNGFIESFLEPTEPVDEVGAAAILAALAAKQQSLSILAQDILIATISEGRLGSDQLSKAIEFHLHNELPKMNRWPDKFAVVADVSLDHATVIRETLEQALSAFPTKQLGPFLNLLHDLSIASESPIKEPATIEYLSKLSGAAGKTAKKLLTIR